MLNFRKRPPPMCILSGTVMIDHIGLRLVQDIGRHFIRDARNRK
jgi:hypothetical protein